MSDEHNLALERPLRLKTTNFSIPHRALAQAAGFRRSNHAKFTPSELTGFFSSRPRWVVAHLSILGCKAEGKAKKPKAVWYVKVGREREKGSPCL
jgi:hypothetical protein